MRLIPVLGSVAALLVAGACTSSGSTPSHPSGGPATHAATSPQSSARGSRPASSASTAPHSSSTVSVAVGPAQRVLNSMSLAQRVGQLIMVDCPSSGLAAPTIVAIQRYHVGSVILDGTSELGVAPIRTLTRQLQALAPSNARLFISTDQEGGLVQRMRGPGFTTIPSALQQGQRTPSQLRSFTGLWGGELRSAGINVDLAPVLDTVPAGNVHNPPIGDLDREYGHTPTRVASRGVAVALGLADAGVDATVKHFPGLGRVSGNTDTTAGVTDRVTTRHDPYLLPFAAAIKTGVPFVMMSTAIYARIDPTRPAVFSPTVVTGMLRQDLGFRGVIITDDIGSARQVAGYPPGQRAAMFIHAGGTIVLTVNPYIVAAMTARLIQRARTDPAFRAQVNAAALVVLRAKLARGLLH